MTASRVRGVAAIYYAMVVVGAGALGAGEEEVVLWTAIVCVMVSILLHGMSAAPLMRRFLDR
jgi:NhaP-type Na+/H+ or K+/H+ antiporter